MAEQENRIQPGHPEAELSFDVGSGNVFEDLGYANAEEMQAKAELVRAISKALEVKGLTQTKGAELMGVDQPTLSKLLRGRTRSFTIDRLSQMLTALGRNVTILIDETDANFPGSFERGHMTVLRRFAS